MLFVVIIRFFMRSKLDINETHLLTEDDDFNVTIINKSKKSIRDVTEMQKL